MKRLTLLTLATGVLFTMCAPLAAGDFQQVFQQQEELNHFVNSQKAEYIAAAEKVLNQELPQGSLARYKVDSVGISSSLHSDNGSSSSVHVSFVRISSPNDSSPKRSSFADDVRSIAVQFNQGRNERSIRLSMRGEKRIHTQVVFEERTPQE